MTKYCYLLIVLLFFYHVSLSHALNNGFSVELIHRDASKPPFQRVANAIRRSLNHANYYNLKNVNGNAQTTVIPDKGEYLMSYSIGTPPFKLYGIVDTGSSVIWFQCKPCVECYNQTSPLFDPSKSTTYKNIPCSSSTCQSDKSTSCSNNRSRNDKGVCEYTISYGDGSKLQGDLSMDTVTLDSTRGTLVNFPNTVVGCGYDNTVSFSGQSSGIVGLGAGSVSFASQLSSSIGGKFSYCLIPFIDEVDSKSSSKLNFGDAAIVSGKGTISTPIVQGSRSNIFYYLSLEAFSVGDERINFGGTSSEEGNIVIDSGTTLTLLPSGVYTQLESVVAKVVKYERADDPLKELSLCYKTTLEHLDVPIITSHFKGGDVLLNSINTFIQVDDEIVCFAFAVNKNDIAIFGNVAQQNFLVGYDLQKKTVSFKPTDCTK